MVSFSDSANLVRYNFDLLCLSGMLSLFTRDIILLLILFFKSNSGASLVAQWLRIRPPMHGTQIRALVPEDPTCRGATKPMRHNY